MKTTIDKFKREYNKHINDTLVFRVNAIHLSENNDYVPYLNKIRKYSIMKITTLSSFTLCTLLFVFTFINTTTSTIQSVLAISNSSIISLLVFGLLSNISLILFFVLKNRYRNYL
jgi:hypothetical protein